MTDHRASGRVIVGVDGSPNGYRALEYAAGQATRMGAELEILYAGNARQEAEYFEDFGIRFPSTAIRAYAEDLLTAARKRVEQSHPELPSRTRYEEGNPTAVLVEASRGAAAVVVGRHGTGAAGSGLFVGAIVSRLASAAGCPVFVVGELDGTTEGPIVVGVDGSVCGDAALRFALSEAVRRSASVRTVTAYRTPPLLAPNDPDLIVRLQKSERQAALRIARDALAYASTERTADVSVEQIVLQSSPALAIVGRATDAQLIVVGSHGRGLVRRWLLGSVSHKVIHDSRRPVAVIGLDHEPG